MHLSGHFPWGCPWGAPQTPSRKIGPCAANFEKTKFYGC